MPGIAGIVYSNPFQMTRLLTPMLDILVHRGPGEREERTHKNIQVGICGSSLATDQNTVVGLDGKISNAEDLRKQLQELGYWGIEETTTELLIHAYHLWGPSFIDHLEGPFALFLLDTHRDRLILARDRMGIRPLYWFQNKHHFIFSSELKSILASRAVPQTVDLDTIANYFYLGYFPQDLTPIKGVNKLLPGHFLQFNKDQTKNIIPYWSLSRQFQYQTNDNLPEVLQKVDSYLTASIGEQIPKGHPFGALLCENLGSTAMANYLKKAVPVEQFSTYSISCEENTESVYQVKIAHALGLDHHNQRLKGQNFLQDLPKIIWHLDEPLADPNIIFTWNLALLARPTRLVFSDVGSSFFFFDSDKYQIEKIKNTAEELYRHAYPFLKFFILPLIKRIHPSWGYGMLQKTRISPSLIEFLNQNSIFPPNILKEAAPNLSNYFNLPVFLHKFPNLNHLRSDVTSILYLDLKTKLPESTILQYDRLLTGNSLEWRTPYLSKNLMEYVCSIPFETLLGKKSPSNLLKMILQDSLSNDILNLQIQKTSIFSCADESKLFEFFKLLPNGALVDAGIVSQKWLSKHVSTTEECRNAFYQLWSIFILEIWFQLYINSPIRNNPPEITLSEIMREV